MSTCTAEDIDTKCHYCEHSYDDDERKRIVLHPSGRSRQHASCMSCVQNFPKKNECPECKIPINIGDYAKTESTQVPDHHNTEAKRMIEPQNSHTTHRKELAESFSHPCTNCDDNAGSRCDDCHIYLCSDCKPAHTKSKTFRHHSVRDLSSLSQDEIQSFHEIQLCEKKNHGLSLDRYCQKCDLLCCLRCEEHVSHGYVKLEDHLKEFHESAIKDGKTVLKKMGDVSGQILALEGMIITVEKKYSGEEEAITRTVENAIQQLKLQENELLESVKKEKGDNVENIETEIRKLKDLSMKRQAIEEFITQERELEPRATLDIFSKIRRCLELAKDPCFLKFENDPDSGVSKFNRNTELDNLRVGYLRQRHTEEDRSSVKGLGSAENEFRMLIIGKNKSGRTKTAFALMSQETTPSSRVYIKSCKNKTFRLRRSHGIVTKADIQKEKVDIEDNLKPGPHVVLLAVKNPDEDVSIVSDYMGIFKDDLKQHLVIVFTGKKDLDKKKMTVEKYVHTHRNEHTEFGRLLTNIDGRCVAVNTDNKDCYESFRETLFKMVSDLATTNSLRYLSLR